LTGHYKGRRRGWVPVSIPVNEELLAVLRNLPSRLTGPWVFPNATDSGPLDGDAFDRLVFRPALARAGITGLCWKDLRHTFATRLRMLGQADLKSSCRRAKDGERLRTGRSVSLARKAV
jgi:integrase